MRSAGKCVSGSFVVLNKPLVAFSGAAAACSKAGKKLATIDAIFGGTSAPRPSWTSGSSSRHADLLAFVLRMCADWLLSTCCRRSTH